MKTKVIKTRRGYRSIQFWNGKQGKYVELTRAECRELINQLIDKL